MKRKDVAFLYDFDGTLAEGNIQEYNFIPALNMTSDVFWKEVSTLAKENEMDGVLAYMYLMLKKAAASDISIRKEAFINYGKGISFYNGVDTWFSRINNYASKKGIRIRHFIVSSGIKEMIEGTQIANEFERIYASSYMYDINGIAKWPALSVNYTNKTQFLFRISKGRFDIYDNSVNESMREKDIEIPFTNMVYFGDGETDIPCMKIVKGYGGKSIAVYDSLKRKLIAEKMMKDKRINYYAESDYRENSNLDKYIKGYIDKLSSSLE
ncbi:MAG: HAD family hydrolase [Clostridia bacterium]|nr:HAD family hydrolase [Clostridia bacterium]MDD4376059.1 HAD family hydrolase [Clostridia bacterium]